MNMFSVVGIGLIVLMVAVPFITMAIFDNYCKKVTLNNTETRSE